LPLIECAVVSVVILAAAVAMFVLFRYDPAAAKHTAAERRNTASALKADIGHVGAFLSRISDYRSTRAAAATLAAVAFGVLEDAAHQVVIGSQLHPALKAMADGIIVAACGGAVVWIILTGMSRRRQSATAQIQAAGELNGQVRNALEVILHACHAAPVADRMMVVQSVEQIEATMQRLQPSLPVGDARLRLSGKDNRHTEMISTHP
jgi:hypothetical protein